MLIVVGVICFGAALSLMLMAKRYSDILSTREGTADVPVRTAVWQPVSGGAERVGTGLDGEIRAEVAAFLEVRRALRLTLDDAPASSGGIDPESTVRLREAARRARERAGLSRRDYARVQAAYARWKAGAKPQNPAHAREFNAARQELLAADLGPYDSVF